MKLKICVKNLFSGLIMKVMCYGKGICVGYRFLIWVIGRLC